MDFYIQYHFPILYNNPKLLQFPQFQFALVLIEDTQEKPKHKQENKHTTASSFLSRRFRHAIIHSREAQEWAIALKSLK